MTQTEIDNFLSGIFEDASNLQMTDMVEKMEKGLMPCKIN